jgi:hypothetical protein
MTHAQRVLTLLNHCTTRGFYAAIVCACLAFAGMLLAPGDHAEQLLALAWLCMLSAITLLLGKLGLELVQDAGGA